MKGVLLGGGKGLRLGPFTKTVTNKHLAPVYTSSGAIPMIDYPIATLKNMGITEILIISSEEHCGDIIEHLGDGNHIGCDFTYKIQVMDDITRPAGIASALKLAKKFTLDDNFVVILGDNYYEWQPTFRECVDDMKNNPNLKCGLFLHKTDRWAEYGVAKLSDANEDGYRHIVDIIEKPKSFISDLAVTGMYVYTPDVYSYLDTLKPSKRGELEISDINRMYAQKGLTWYTIFDSFWSDMGTYEGMSSTYNYIKGEL